jgi:alpha-beta hydrolase superfamily lysophospholipase
MRKFSLVFALLVLAWPAVADGQDFTQETIRWRTGDVALEGTLYLPKTSGPHPAAVFIHGSGTLTRSDRMYREHAERFARMGLAMLVYDKRGTGTSTGSWRTATFSDLADDALGGVQAVRQHKAIARDKVGLFGASQGGWIVLIAASRDPSIAFIVTLSGPAITPAEQGHYVVEARMRLKKHSEDAIARAVTIDRQVAEVYRTGNGRNEAGQAVQAISGEPWFADAGIGLQPEDSWNWKWYRDLPMDFDPIPPMKALRIPLFAAHGETDALVPAARSAETVGRLATAGKNDLTAVIYPAVGHILYTGGSSRAWTAPDKYWTDVEAWLRARKILTF